MLPEGRLERTQDFPRPSEACRAVAQRGAIGRKPRSRRVAGGALLPQRPDFAATFRLGDPRNARVLVLAGDEIGAKLDALDALTR